MAVTVYRYENSLEFLRETRRPVVFLAGPTVRGNQPHLTSWRFEAIEEFDKQGFNGTLIVPEFTIKTESDKGKEWIPRWEFLGLRLADAIMFWLPRTRELIGLTTNFELGYWLARDRNKVVYGRPDDAYRISYCDIMWKADAENTGREMLPICTTLKETVRVSISRANDLFYRSRH